MIVKILSGLAMATLAMPCVAAVQEEPEAAVEVGSAHARTFDFTALNRKLADAAKAGKGARPDFSVADDGVTKMIANTVNAQRRYSEHVPRFYVPR